MKTADGYIWSKNGSRKIKNNGGDSRKMYYICSLGKDECPAKMSITRFADGTETMEYLINHNHSSTVVKTIISQRELLQKVNTLQDEFDIINNRFKHMDNFLCELCPGIDQKFKESNSRFEDFRACIDSLNEVNKSINERLQETNMKLNEIQTLNTDKLTHLEANIEQIKTQHVNETTQLNESWRVIKSEFSDKINGTRTSLMDEFKELLDKDIISKQRQLEILSIQNKCYLQTINNKLKEHESSFTNLFEQQNKQNLEIGDLLLSFKANENFIETKLGDIHNKDFVNSLLEE